MNGHIEIASGRTQGRRPIKIKMYWMTAGGLGFACWRGAGSGVGMNEALRLSEYHRGDNLTTGALIERFCRRTRVAHQLLHQVAGKAEMRQVGETMVFYRLEPGSGRFGALVDRAVELEVCSVHADNSDDWMAAMAVKMEALKPIPVMVAADGGQAELAW